MSSKVWMTCGHQYYRSEIQDIIEDTLATSKEAIKFRCRKPKCAGVWDLDYCAQSAELSEDAYLRYAEEIANRTAPMGKPCPFCNQECAEPKGYIRVRCSACFIGDDWCWLCSSKWNNLGDYKDCGNRGCESNVNVESDKTAHKSEVEKAGKNRNDTDDDYKAEPKVEQDKNETVETIQPVTKDEKTAKTAKTTKEGKEKEKKEKKEKNQSAMKQNDKADEDTMVDDEKKPQEKSKKKRSKRNDIKSDKTPKDTKSTTTKRESKKEMPSRRKMKHGLVGLSNLGNTCFMNAALQTMLRTPQFIPLFFNDQVKIPFFTSSVRKKKKIDKSSLTFTWSQFVKQMYTSNSQYISPYDMKRALNGLRECIGNGDQQDSFYVISTLLQALDEELCPNESEMEHAVDIYDEKDVPPPEEMKDFIINTIWEPYIAAENKSDNSCIIREIFDGIECETLSCCICNYKSKIFKPFREIELPLVDKLINLTIKVFVPQINKMRAYEIELDLTYDNTLDGLKYLILAKVNNSESKRLRKLNKENLSIKIGYIHPSNNRNKAQDMNRWFRYLNDDTNDCSKIPEHAQLIALVHDNSGNLDGDDDEKMDGSKPVYIPRFNLICDKNDNWITQYMDDMTFTQFWPSNTSISGKDIIDKESKISPKFVRDNYTFTVFYNNNVVHPKRPVSITRNGCLLCIWVHKEYEQASPELDTNIDFEESDGIVIHRAMANANTTENGFSFESVMNTVSHYYRKIPSFSFSSFLPGYTSDMDQEMNKQIQEEKNQAQKTYTKLKRLSNIEKMANDWLNSRLSSILSQNIENQINITSPRILHHVAECLEAYESQEVSSANVMDCLRCDDCPEIASKQVEVLKTPNVLILHIDRNGSNDGSYYRKRDHMIKYPVYNLKFKDGQYDLYGVVVHHGGNNGGHYICYAKNLGNKRWYEMDDTSVYPVNDINIITNDATVLLYHKK